MAASQVDEALLVQLRDRVGQRVTQWRPRAEVLDVAPLTGGTSSLTFLVELAGVAPGETPVVLKVAPPGLAPLRNRDVLRQARLQQAVQGAHRALAPDVLFSDPGDPPEVPPFMAMNMVPGECVEPVLSDDAERPAARQVRDRCLDAVQVLALLHRIVPGRVGLGDEPAVGLADEVDLWTRAFATLPAEMAGDYQRAAKALRASLPAPLAPAINHGDFRLGNTLCAGGRVNAVIDWEIWSVGDPRIDLARLTFFTDDARHPAVAPGTVAGTPTGRQGPGQRPGDLGQLLVVEDADQQHTFRVPELLRGISDTYYAQLLVRLVGPVRTRDLMFTGRRLTAAEALDWGLVSRVVPHHELIKTSAGALIEIVQTAPEARRDIKRVLDQYVGLQDRIAFFDSLQRPESKEGFASFIEKRSPNWVPELLRRDARA